MSCCLPLHLIALFQTFTYCYSNNVTTDNFTESQTNGTSTSTALNNLTQAPSTVPFLLTFTQDVEKTSTSDHHEFMEPINGTAPETRIPAWAIALTVILVLSFFLVFAAYFTYSKSATAAKSQRTNKNPGHVAMKEIRHGKLQKSQNSMVDERTTATADMSVADEGRRAISTHDSACKTNIDFNSEYDCQEITDIDEDRAMSTTLNIR